MKSDGYRVMSKLAPTINGFPVSRVSLSELRKAPYNPRKISNPMKESLRESIRVFGNVEPIVVNRATGNIVGGHQRLDALIDIGETETDIIEIDIPAEKEKALNIALNKISGEWDLESLSGLILSLQDSEKVLTGFSHNEIEKMATVVLPPEELSRNGLISSIIVTLEMDEKKYEEISLTLKEWSQNGITVNIS